jgi:alcohol dehydrogenase class IV
LPAVLTADTGMDAMTHAVETVASPAANHFVDAHAFTALDIINTQLVTAVQQGGDLGARSSMLQASTMACNAFVNALGPYPVHNCAHAFGSVCHIPHGRANGVLLPIVLEALPEFYLPTAKRLARALDVSQAGASDVAQLDAVITRIRALQSAVDMPSSFAYLDIPTARVEALAMAIASDPVAAFFPIPEETIVAIVGRAISP